MQKIIIMLHANADVRNGDVKEALTNLSLKDAIINKCGDNSPSMYDKGKSPIDGISFL